MNKTVILSLFLAFLVSCAQQEIKLPTAKPEEVGLSTERLNRIKPLMQRYVDKKNFRA